MPQLDHGVAAYPNGQQESADSRFEPIPECC